MSGYTIGGNQTLTKKVSLTSAQILQLNSTPQTMLPAPGAGLTYAFLNVYARLNFGTVAYATNTTIQIFFSPGAVALYSNTPLLTSTVTRIHSLAPAPMSGTATQYYLTNTQVVMNVMTGNPTLGDGTLDVYFIYRILTL